jgi:hypothetical protein
MKNAGAVEMFGGAEEIIGVRKSLSVRLTGFLVSGSSEQQNFSMEF